MTDRRNQTLLFQPAGAAYPSALGGKPYNTDQWGPTALCVDYMGGWVWKHPGGDWVDANLVSQGPTAWSSVAVNGAAGQSYTVDVTSIVNHCAVAGRHMAIVLRRSGGWRTIAGLFTDGVPPPVINLVYDNGEAEALECTIVAVNGSTSPQTAPATNEASNMTPVFMEFVRPVREIQSATLTFTVLAMGPGNATLNVMLLDPPIALDAATGEDGLVAQAGMLDDGLQNVPGIIGVHRYMDGAPESDFLAPGVWNCANELSYDPLIFGRGEQDLTKLPHLHCGKWLNNGDEGLVSVVPSTYAGDGFVPLVPGMGALRVCMPKKDVFTGQEQGNGGTVAADRFIMFPAPIFGRLKRVFVRYYVYLAPYTADQADRIEIRRYNQPTFTDMGGKCGITPHHLTYYGGVTQTAGGGKGTQFRDRWTDCEIPGPNKGSVIFGDHAFDYGKNNEVSYSGEPRWMNGYGQRGGYGGHLYFGRWYLVEQEVDLNSVDQLAPNGRYWSLDGSRRTWIDGHLVYERTGMVWRSLPLFTPVKEDGTPDLDPARMRPIENLGHKGLWMCEYHGGLSNSTVERVKFYTGLAWAEQRIGPMKMAG